ncbi:hypothetical protein D3C81_1666820 [compost metagenome]
MTLARKNDSRPVRVSTRCDKAIEHMLMCRWTKRIECHWRIRLLPSTSQNSLVVRPPTLGR